MLADHSLKIQGKSCITVLEDAFDDLYGGTQIELILIAWYRAPRTHILNSVPPTDINNL